MTATEKLAEIIKTYVITPQGKALGDALKDLQDIHKAEEREYQAAREDIDALKTEIQGAEAAFSDFRAAHLALANRVVALEVRNASDDQIAEEALKGFTGEGAPNPGGGAPSAGDEPAGGPAPEGAEHADEEEAKPSEAAESA